MIHKILSHLLTETEIENLKPSAAHTDNNAVLQELLNSNKLIMVDWKGEGKMYEIGNFFTERAAKLKHNVAFDLKQLYDQAAESAHETGDFVPVLLSIFKPVLKKASLSIVLLDRGNDQYYIGLTMAKNARILKKQSDEFWKFREFGTSSGEVLYTVYCTCGSMNMWQLKRGELLVDDVCQDCGKLLFDAKGEASLPVIKEYF